MSRQYLSAGAIVDEVGKGKSIKSYCAGIDKLGKVDFALALQTLKYRETIIKILARCTISADTLDVSEGVLLVMVYELLFGEGKIKGGGCVKRRVMTHIDGMKEALEHLMQGKSHHVELLSKQIRDYSKIGSFLRVNMVKASIEEGLKYVRAQCPTAYLDQEVPSLIVVPVSASMNSFGQDPWVKSGKLIIQDKASCFPSQMLYDAWCQHHPWTFCSASGGGDIIDACAAPGNKTSHIAALVAQARACNANLEEGSIHVSQSPPLVPVQARKVFAFEKNPRRAALLRDRMHLMGVTNVIVTEGDFLTIDVRDPKYAEVTGVLLDPSCSGSGVVRSLERALEIERNQHPSNSINRIKAGSESAKKAHGRKEEEDEEEEEEGGGGGGSEQEQVIPVVGVKEDSRLQKLQAFQLKAIRKAMQFPAVQTIVYSTCSIHTQENEDVVASVLHTHGDRSTFTTASASSSSSSSGNDAYNSIADSGNENSHGGFWDVVAPRRFGTWARRGVAAPPPPPPPHDDDDDDDDDDARLFSSCLVPPASCLTAEQCQALIRCSPEDGTNGFFVAQFERHGQGRGCTTRMSINRSVGGGSGGGDSVSHHSEGLAAVPVHVPVPVPVLCNAVPSNGAQIEQRHYTVVDAPILPAGVPVPVPVSVEARTSKGKQYSSVDHTTGHQGKRKHNRKAGDADNATEIAAIPQAVNPHGAAGSLFGQSVSAGAVGGKRRFLVSKTALRKAGRNSKRSKKK